MSYPPKERLGFRGVKVGRLVSVVRGGAGVCRLIVVGSLNWGLELGRCSSSWESESLGWELD